MSSDSPFEKGERIAFPIHNSTCSTLGVEHFLNQKLFSFFSGLFAEFGKMNNFLGQNK